MRTTSKEFMQKVQKTILSHFDSIDALKSEIKNYYNQFGYNFGKTMVEYGCFDCYYSQVAETMAWWFNCSVNDIWKYYKDDEQKMWDMYINLISRELRHIKAGNKSYIETK